MQNSDEHFVAKILIILISVIRLPMDISPKYGVCDKQTGIIQYCLWKHKQLSNQNGLFKQTSSMSVLSAAFFFHFQVSGAGSSGSRSRLRALVQDDARLHALMAWCSRIWMTLTSTPDSTDPKTNETEWFFNARMEQKSEHLSMLLNANVRPHLAVTSKRPLKSVEVLKCSKSSSYHP